MPQRKLHYRVLLVLARIQSIVKEFHLWVCQVHSEPVGLGLGGEQRVVSDIDFGLDFITMLQVEPVENMQGLLISGSQVLGVKQGLRTFCAWRCYVNVFFAYNICCLTIRRVL